MSDINKLKDILSRSKAVMDKTEVEYGTTADPSTTINSYGEKEMPNLTENFKNRQTDRSTRSVAPQNGRYKNLENTKMPREIVEAMINNPIEVPETPYPTFELDDVSELIESPTAHIESAIAGSATPTPSNNKDIRKIVREEIGSVVREVVEEYLDKALITEDIQIKIGSTVFSGNLKPLPKKRKTKRRV